MRESGHRTHRTHRVPVAGGALVAGEWADGDRPGAATVLALHGITAHHHAWDLVAAALPEHRVLAPDLRGRGRSNTLPGPWGLDRHADDVAAVVRGLAEGPVTVVGHSMGGFVAVVLAHRHPDVVDRLVLVDGGLPFAPAELATTRAALDVIRTRLEARWPDEAAYVEAFRRHPALARDWSVATERYATYDAEPCDQGVRAAADLEAVLADQVDVLDGSALPEALAHLGEQHRVTFLHAPRGFADDPPGLYASDTVAGLRRRFPDVEVRAVADVNHYTVTLSTASAAAVARAVAGAG